MQHIDHALCLHVKHTDTQTTCTARERDRDQRGRQFFKITFESSQTWPEPEAICNKTGFKLTAKKLHAVAHFWFVDHSPGSRPELISVHWFYITAAENLIPLNVKKEQSLFYTCSHFRYSCPFKACTKQVLTTLCDPSSLPFSPLTQIYCQSLCPDSPYSARCCTKSSAQCSAGESVYVHHKGLFLSFSF